MSAMGMLRQLRFPRAYEHRRNVVAIHPIGHSLLRSGSVAVSYARHHWGYLRQNRCLGTTDRVLLIHRQNVAALVSCGGEVESTSMEKWHYDCWLWSEHGLLNANRRTGNTRAHHRWAPVLFASLDARLSRWILDRTVRSGSCVDRNGPT